MALQGPASPGQQASLLLGQQPSVQGAADSQGSPPPTQTLQVWMQECWSGHVNRRKKWFPSQRLLALFLTDPSSNPACRFAGCVTWARHAGSGWAVSSCAQRGNQAWGCCVWAKRHASAKFPQRARHKRCSKRAALFPGPLSGSTSRQRSPEAGRARSRQE